MRGDIFWTDWGFEADQKHEGGQKLGRGQKHPRGDHYDYKSIIPIFNFLRQWINESTWSKSKTRKRRSAVPLLIHHPDSFLSQIQFEIFFIIFLSQILFEILNNYFDFHKFTFQGQVNPASEEYPRGNRISCFRLFFF